MRYEALKVGQHNAGDKEERKTSQAQVLDDGLTVEDRVDRVGDLEG
eukprot:CAMPEP_0202049874 /NCGR_PEP_ID=MMETSP0963-20130614/3657_1 /ASSEMBLY_ACC=CAM_ASM_000494 /TAXON_ID=4773 /ORGANISM="Schizochytrium aggregatum, Strain ATCC28209" /LENGTH=45 /DNA_ID= /DNA_START= /DNA_END= /DNA_ORIENTATION=